MKCKQAQSGLALSSVLVLMSLLAWVALSSWRQVVTHAFLLNAQTDHLRAQQQALATLMWAKQLIQEKTNPQLPSNLQAWSQFRQQLPWDGCRNGFCAFGNDNLSPGLSFWKTQTQHARALPAEFSIHGDNKAWYWIEVLPDAQRVKAQAADPFVYRITVLAQGVKPASLVVQQAMWQSDADPLNTGRWLSWKTLLE